MDFCEQMDISPAPITEKSLVRYAAYLASSLSYASIGKYLNIIRIIHRELSLPNPLQDNYALNVVLKGIRKAKGDTTKRKLPITPRILLNIRDQLSMSSPKDIIFWAACLVSFYGLFRKANIAPKSVRAFDKNKHFTTGDLEKCHQGLVLIVKHTKTIQCRERSLQIPLPFLNNHPLCPTTAVINMLRVKSSLDPNTPLFSLGTANSLLTQPVFVSRLREVLQRCGLDETNYSGHSFRRGGASWAFEAGLPGEMIQQLGDWKSAAYLVYLEINLQTKFHWIQQFACKLPY